jgi:uncharacterized YigZ family protein
MRVPAGEAHAEIVVRRSRFIADAVPIHSRDDAESIVRARRASYPDASHVVYAFAFGAEKSVQFGMSDDGEPKGTAGRPVLEILRGTQITDCVVTIVRYFGGTKLGTGGLVRAYGDAARACLSALTTAPKRQTAKVLFVSPYELSGAVRSALAIDGVIEVNEEYGETVRFRVEVDRRVLTRVRRRIRDVSRGTIQIEET